MLTQSFKDSYSNLNKGQKEAVDTIDGPVMVIAGPGTGKTQILTLRIANILQKTDTAPENILALTFTESGAANMRKRLTELIGSAGYYVEISTFHGFANRLIQEYPEYFPIIIGGRNATDIDQIAILREILDNGIFERLKPLGDRYHYVGDILSAIKSTKQEGYSPANFKSLVNKRRADFDKTEDLFHEKGAHVGMMKLEHQKRLQHIEKNLELGTIYEQYEDKLRERKLYDFEDMILETLRALGAKKEFLLEAQEKAQYILVDEHQDTNGAQNKLLELLMSFHPHPNLFVVGDEKQAIYRFQGASLDNFLYFQKKYPEARLVYLEENYRSTQTILDSAQSLIEHNTTNIHAPLVAKHPERKDGKKISSVPLSSPDVQYLYLSKEVADLIKAGVEPHEIAVLYRENRDAEPAGLALDRAKIPYVIESDQNVLADADIMNFLKLLEAISSLGEEEKLVEALHIDFLDVPALDIWKLLDLRIKRGYISLYRLASSKEMLAEGGFSDPEKIYLTISKFEKWKRLSKNKPFLEFFSDLVRESGFLDHLLKNPGYFEKVGKLNTLYDEAKKAVGNNGGYSLEDYVSYLQILREHRVMIRAKAQRVPGAVRLMTAHRAKGLEFDHVFILDVYDGKWGNKRRGKKLILPFETAVDASELEKNEDERRLFYMALTRARKHVSILWSSHNAEGKELVPSQFIGEIRAELIEEVRPEEAEKEAVSAKVERFALHKPAVLELTDKEFLRDLFRNRGFSVTALNNYLACPWRYFYSNLLRIPQAETPHQVYGTAVHSALQRFFTARKGGDPVPKEFILERYKEALLRRPLPEKDRERLLIDGQKTISAYYDNYEPTWSYRVLTEYSVSGIALTEDIVLTGKLDKVELLDADKEVNVIDYKVKQPESRNWIEGKTLSSNGDYKRQLVFYKLLLDEDKERGLVMRKGIIDFVQPNDRGKFKQEEFEVSDVEVAELKELILKVGGEILNLEFWNKGCGDKECVYCGLRKTQGVSIQQEER